MQADRVEDRRLVRGPVTHDDIRMGNSTLYYMTRRKLGGNERQTVYTQDWAISQEFEVTWVLEAGIMLC